MRIVNLGCFLVERDGNSAWATKMCVFCSIRAGGEEEGESEYNDDFGLGWSERASW